MCSTYSQPGCWNHILDLLNALNLIVPSASRSVHWLQCCKHKYLQFSEFEILQQLHSSPLTCSNYSQLSIWNPVLDLLNVANLLVPPYALWLGPSNQKHLQFSHFKNLLRCLSPTLWYVPITCTHPRYSILGLFNALNLIVPSSLLSSQWLRCCRHKYLQFS